MSKELSATKTVKAMDLSNLLKHAFYLVTPQLLAKTPLPTGGRHCGSTYGP